MFTGIIAGVFPASIVENQQGLTRYCVAVSPALREGLELGASVAVNGICHTVSAIDEQGIWFDSMSETLSRTTIKSLQPNDMLNIERSARFGDEIGGHEVSGHVDGTMPVISVAASANNHVIGFQLPAAYRDFVFDKGFLSIHGASLTVSDYDRRNGNFKVYLIPETLRLTNLGELEVGDNVNFEIDRKTQVIIETVRQIMQQQQRGD